MPYLRGILPNLRAGVRPAARRNVLDGRAELTRPHHRFPGVGVSRTLRLIPFYILKPAPRRTTRSRALFQHQADAFLLLELTKGVRGFRPAFKPSYDRPITPDHG